MRLSVCFTVDSVTFTKGVIAGTTSLGGSESACVGLARALQARGHDVHIFTTKLAEDVDPIDHAGVTWHDMARVKDWSTFKDWDVAVALRQPIYLASIRAKFKMLWNQDLMANAAMKNYVMSMAWAYDAVAYVSRYHQAQWEALVPDLKGIGWATKNGHDAALADAARKSAVKKPNQIIHISRPERGLLPILEMWKALRSVKPDAELKLCRYSSMYDPQGWGEVCKGFDHDVALLQQEVGGIEYLGELGKPELYQAIAESAVMWYPGVSTFAETSCIAAIEAQACGTPFVGSYKGALPETVPSGVLIAGVAESDPGYQRESIANVVGLLSGCATQSFTYRTKVKAGLAHVTAYSYEAVAAEWEAYWMDAFAARYETQKPAILRRLDHEDDLTMASLVASELDTPEAAAVLDIAGKVSRGESHTADNYAEHALDPEFEISQKGPRHQAVVKQFPGCRNLIDVACGNGAFAIMLAQDDPERHITAVDFSAQNIEAGRKAAEALGVSDQITWVVAPVWDMVAQKPSEWLASLSPKTFDGAFCGEFIEHVTDCTALVEAVERVVTHMGRIVWSMPFGPLNTLLRRHDKLYRSHVHHFRPADCEAVFGQKNAYVRMAIPWGSITGRAEPVGNWLITYRNDGPTGHRPYERRLLIRPYLSITAGIITDNTMDLRRCLDHVWTVVDEIVIGDCGADPVDLARIAEEFPRKTRVIPVGRVPDLVGGFAEARNTVLAAAKGDWFFWIDCDEVLCGHTALGKYLDGPVFQGLSIKQNHLYMDGPMGTDTPVRVFRKRPDIQFYGCVHEQPQRGDCNGEVTPALQLADVQIAHSGYTHEVIRRDKAINRNLPLLIRDQKVFPDRELGKLLLLREHANLAMWALEATRGVVTDNVKAHYGQVVALFEAHFMDPANKHHALARPFYEQALKHIDGSIEVEVAVAGGLAPNGLNGERAKPMRVWARTPEHLRTLLHGQIEQMLAPLKGEAPMDCEPLPREVVDCTVEPV